MLGALAQDTRLEVFRLLVEALPGGLPAGTIGEQLGLRAPTLSFHLAQLRHAGLVSSLRDGRSIIYSAEHEQMNALLTHLTRSCCGGRPEICGPLVENLSKAGARSPRASKDGSP